MSKDIIPTERVAQKILYLRREKVPLDRDLAALCGVETRTVNQAVKRNAARFPGDFLFTLSREEIERISQTVTSSTGPKFSKQVRAFTEQGVAMLSSVLNIERAGERTRLACWRWRPRRRELFVRDTTRAFGVHLRTFRRWRRKGHARRACSPIQQS
jgi:hypothetical protein